MVVVFATMVEYTCSPLLEVYLYRFHNVPAYVPPGHGLVYLAALAIGRTAFVRAHTRAAPSAALVGVGGYAAYGLLLADRTRRARGVLVRLPGSGSSGGARRTACTSARPSS